jgi:hypothetical protein
VAQKGLLGSKLSEGFYDTAEPRQMGLADFSLLVLVEGRFLESVLYAANFDRDDDTIASSSIRAIAGGLRGPPGGSHWLDRPDPTGNLVSRNTLAEGILDAVSNTHGVAGP